MPETNGRATREGPETCVRKEIEKDRSRMGKDEQTRIYNEGLPREKTRGSDPIYSTYESFTILNFVNGMTLNLSTVGKKDPICI